MTYCDILILTNGPGEVTTWVRPVVKALGQKLRDKIRISVILSPCANGTGKEAQIASSYPEVDRVQAAEFFFDFLVWGKTKANWDWYNQGVVLFLGGDQFFPVIISKRLGYKTVIYAEWEARWYQLIDYFGIRKAEILNKIPVKYHHKFTVVGDLMTDISTEINNSNKASKSEIIGLLPGSKAAKLAQGVPLFIAIAELIHQKRPQTQFIIPVAPTINLEYLAKFANPQENPILSMFGNIKAELIINEENNSYLKTAAGLKIKLITEFPAYTTLAECCLCFTTIGANTAELAALAIPMLVLIPTQQLDAMRAWDGIPGILANLPGIGTNFAKLINWWVLRKKRLFAWPNIWANQEIVPEFVGHLQPEIMAEIALNYLKYPQKLEIMRLHLEQVRGESGAANKLTEIIFTEISHN